MGSSCCCCLVVFLLVLAALGVTTLSIPQVWTFATGAWHSISNVFSATKQVVVEIKNLTRVKRSLGEDQDLADLVRKPTEAVAIASIIQDYDYNLDHDPRLDQTPSIPTLDMDSTHLEKLWLGSVAAVGAVLFAILLYCVIKCIWKRWPITSTAESNQSSSPSVSEISDIEAAPESNEDMHNEQLRLIKVKYAWLFDDEVMAGLAARNEPLLVGIRLSICRSHVRALERSKANLRELSANQMSTDKRLVLKEERSKILNLLLSDYKQLNELVAKLGATNDERAEIRELERDIARVLRL
jgi:hypothetical protein